METPIDRRHFVASVAAGLGTQLVAAPGDAVAQTASTARSTTRPLPPDPGLYPGFEARWVRTNGADIFVRHGGTGPPLLLLHGNPLTLSSWHKIAGPLARKYHIVATDLRGYGDSVGPVDGGVKHINYSFRAMAQDQVDVMTALGFDRYFVAGHDRGARVAHRMALDHPERVRKLALLDILPTRYVWNNTSREWALNSWHWVFMAQPDEMFERMIEAVPAQDFIMRHLGRTGKPAFIDDRALAEYIRCFTPKTIHGSCEDYRAAAGIDLEHDEADHKAGRKIAAPALIVWGSRSHTGRFYGGDLLSIWREEAADVTGGPLNTGHYIAEEGPAAVAESFERFFI